MRTNGLSNAARSALFAPVDTVGRVEVVVRRLSEAIALGLVTDGEQLPSEAELATQLGVSTATLREALMALRQQGLIETIRGRGGGSFVHAPKDPLTSELRRRLRHLTAEELRDIADHYAAIAGAAALLAAERASDTDVRNLHEAIEELEKAQSAGDRRHADGLFHVEVAAAAQSARLTREEIRLQSEIGGLLWLPFGEAITHEAAIRQHQDIAQAVAHGAGEDARRLAERHIREALEYLTELHLQLVDD